MSVQIILKEGKPEYAVIPYELYEQLVADAEMLEDIRDYDEAIRVVENGQELVPSEVVYALLEGANPIRVWREYRGLTQGGCRHQRGLSVTVGDRQTHRYGRGAKNDRHDTGCGCG